MNEEKRTEWVCREMLEIARYTVRSGEHFPMMFILLTDKGERRIYGFDVCGENAKDNIIKSVASLINIYGASFYGTIYEYWGRVFNENEKPDRQIKDYDDKVEGVGICYVSRSGYKRMESYEIDRGRNLTLKHITDNKKDKNELSGRFFNIFNLANIYKTSMMKSGIFFPIAEDRRARFEKIVYKVANFDINVVYGEPL